MRLKSIQVKNYRSVEDSGAFAIDDITCLVGKNESGKTAILKAIEGIKPFNKETKYDKTTDYPRRHLNEYASRHNDQAEVCISEWELDPEDIKALEKEFGSDCLKSNNIEVTKLYGGGGTWCVELNEENIIRHLCSKQSLNEAETAVVEECNTVQEMYKKITASDMNPDTLNSIKERIEKYRDKNVTLKAIDILSQKIPSFVYFSHYSRMSGELSIAQYKTDNENNKVKENDKLFADFLTFAGTSIEEIEGAQKHEDFKAKIEAASNSITDQIFEYWTQNTRLAIEFEVSVGKPDDPPPFNSGTVMRARVKNEIHRASVPFSERSAGFIWFFSFLIHFSQVKKHYANSNTNVVVLLDEPGLTLHAKAQYDLLNYIQEKLAPDHQVIYSTHSPFMIIPDKLESIRTVEDVVIKKTNGRPDIQGTKVSSDFLTTSRDTIFPLQSALGYEISQTLFIGERVILVEGVSDLLYLKTLSNILKENGKSNLEKWVLCPAGGIDKIAPFVNLFLAHGEHRKIVALTDYQEGHKKKVQLLRNTDLLKSLFLYSDFCDKQEADVEDLFEKSLYLKILKQSCGIDINPENVNDSKRIVKEIELLCDGFSHCKPADWLIRNSNMLRTNSDDATKTVDRFERLFTAINENS